MTDVISDVFMLVSYYNVGAMLYFEYNLIFLLMTLGVQALLVMQGRKWKISSSTLFELLITLLCLKPTFDAYR